VHRLRSYTDAVLVGVNTVIADDPQLTVRAVEGRNPLRLVLDPSLRLPLESNLLDKGSGTRTIVAAAERIEGSRVARLEKKGAEIWKLPVNEDGRIDLQVLLDRTGQEGITSLLVEGGATVFTAFLKAHLAHKLHLFIAPTILGSGRSAIGDLGIQSLQDAVRLRDIEIERFDGDVLITGYFG
jgi:riboflavin-specific deaminase-like protein